MNLSKKDAVRISVAGLGIMYLIFLVLIGDGRHLNTTTVATTNRYPLGLGPTDRGNPPIAPKYPLGLGPIDR